MSEPIDGQQEQRKKWVKQIRLWQKLYYPLYGTLRAAQGIVDKPEQHDWLKQFIDGGVKSMEAVGAGDVDFAAIDTGDDELFNLLSEQNRSMNEEMLKQQAEITNLRATLDRNNKESAKGMYLLKEEREKLRGEVGRLNDKNKILESLRDVNRDKFEAAREIAENRQKEIERLHLQLDKYNELATSADYFLNNPDASKLEGYHWLVEALKSLGYRNPDMAARQGQEGGEGN
jgi:hypothetical protein